MNTCNTNRNLWIFSSQSFFRYHVLRMQFETCHIQNMLQRNTVSWSRNYLRKTGNGTIKVKQLSHILGRTCWQSTQVDHWARFLVVETSSARMRRKEKRIWRQTKCTPVDLETITCLIMICEKSLELYYCSGCGVIRKLPFVTFATIVLQASFLCFQFMYTPDKNAVVDVESLVTMSNYPLRRTKEPCNGKNGGRTLSVESLNRSGPVLFQALGLSCCVKKNSATGKTVGQTRSVESL